MITSSDILRAKILIVDDKEANVSLLEQMLCDAGYLSIYSTRNPCEVCALYSKNRFDLILLDLQMPVMDGFQVMEELKKIETDGYLPVLVLTAQPNHKLRALNAGAKDFISKPFDLAEVLLRVHNMIEVRLLHLETKKLYDRVLVEQILSKQLLLVFRSGPVAMSTATTVGTRIIDVNEQYCRFFGYSRDELVGRSKVDLKLWANPEDLTSVMHQLIATGTIHDFETKLRRKSGEVRDILASFEVIELSEDGIPVLITMFIDITERKQAEERLRQNEERYRKMIMLSPDAQFVHVDGTITFVNQAFCRLMGAVEPAQLLGRHVMDVIHPACHELMRGWVRKQFDGLPIPPSEMKFIRLDGSNLAVEVASMGFNFLDHREVQVIARDITERKRLDEHFMQAQKMEALGQFSGGVAHDFNNILMAISGYTELSLMILKENSKVHENLAAVLQASRRATDLVRQILTFSRQQPLVHLSIKLQPVVVESFKLLRSTIPSTIEFESSISEDSPTVLANANQIHQVLMNLGTNAWHAMKDRPGHLKVKLERVEIDEAHAAIQPGLLPGIYAHLSVADTGCGMDRETQRRIFEPFFTTKPPGEGTGLGLSVVHGIMNSHHGVITVQSTPGEGSVFQLYFPAHTGVNTVLAVQEGPVPRGHGQRVLFVDDEDLLARLGQQSLVALGYEVEFSTEPATALAMVRADPLRFALVLTDQTMPGMTGMILASELLKIRPGLPIILMTGYSASLTSECVQAAGINQLLLKPTSLYSLGTAVQKVLAEPTLV